MPLRISIYRLFVLSVFSTFIASAQTYTELGMANGSGIVILPSTTISPKSELRINYGRLELMQKGYRGINVYQASAGFSSTLEGYVKFSMEESAVTNSVGAVGFGMKFRMPFDVPLVDHLALWGETAHSENEVVFSVFPATINRVAMIGTIEQKDFQIILLGGIYGSESLSDGMYGCGATLALGHSMQIGAEYFYGYTGQKSWLTSLNGSYRFFSNMSIQISPGYLKSPVVSSWTISAGISISTADIDFSPVVEQKKDDFTLPSFEEIEKQSQEKNKNE